MGNAQGRTRDRGSDSSYSGGTSGHNGPSLMGFGLGHASASNSNMYNSEPMDSMPPQLIDGGLTMSQGALYSTTSADYDRAIVRRLVIERRLAPFYRGMNCDTDIPCLPDGFVANPTPGPTPSVVMSAAATSASIPISLEPTSSMTARSHSESYLASINAEAGPQPILANSTAEDHGTVFPQYQPTQTTTLSDPAAIKISLNTPAIFSTTGKSTGRSLTSLVRNRTSAILSTSPGSMGIGQRSLSTNALTEIPPRQISLAQLYKTPIECPICFLYYPKNINFTRCCDHPICTDCFIQIKRSQTTFEPAECPYCVVPNFGITYSPIGSMGYMQRYDLSYRPPGSSQAQHQDDATCMSASTGENSTASSSLIAHGRRRKSISFDNPAVVLSDELRPNWQHQKHQAAMGRVLNQRRHILPGHIRPNVLGEAEITSAATAAADLLETLTRFENASSSSERRAVRRAARETQRDSSYSYLQAMRHMGADIEELMVLEAIRLSLATSNDPLSSTMDIEATETSAALSQIQSIDDTQDNLASRIERRPESEGVSASPDHSSSIPQLHYTDASESNLGISESMGNTTHAISLNDHLDNGLVGSSALSVVAASLETSHSNAQTFDTSSLRTDRYIHVTLEPMDSTSDGGEVSSTILDDGSEMTTTENVLQPQAMRILAISTRDENARRDADADDAVSFDSLAARKSMLSDADGEGSQHTPESHVAIGSHDPKFGPDDGESVQPFLGAANE
ncbi:SNF1-interacting protein [Batrachochytrium dendrobatidis]